MTKSEMHRNDLAFVGPALLFLNQYFNSFINEYCLLWVALVRLLSVHLSNVKYKGDMTWKT